MNELVNNGLIEEINSGNNFEIVLGNQVPFMETDYKVLQSQGNDIFVKCMKIKRNGQTDICYLSSDYRSLSSILQSITSEAAIAIASALTAAITKVKTNGFLSCQSILLASDKIFVDMNTYSVRLVYLPISEKCFATMDDFEAAYKELLNQLAPGADAQTLANISVSNNQSESITLVAMDAPYPFEITISEDNALIGKKAELVDKVIDFNNAISRKHCRILKENGSFFIMDEGSANGTYINGKRLDPQVKAPVKSGDLICLANSEFEVK